jgi:hypothetical protein
MRAGLLSRYHAHLVRRATGLSRYGWYPASAWQSSPWVAALALSVLIANQMAPPPGRLLTLALSGVPALIGWAYVQIVMAGTHLSDFRNRPGR